VTASSGQTDDSLDGQVRADHSRDPRSDCSGVLAQPCLEVVHAHARAIRVDRITDQGKLGEREHDRDEQEDPQDLGCSPSICLGDVLAGVEVPDARQVEDQPSAERGPARASSQSSLRP
jgi:hypothetical protein